MPISSSPEPIDRRPRRLAGAILAAGRGRRMEEMAWLPKTLLPVVGRPLLESQLRLFARLGAERVVVVVANDRGPVADYLETTGHLRHGVEVAVQPTATGSGDALLCLEDRLAGPFVLFLGDILLQAEDDLAPLVDPVTGGQADATLAVVWETDAGRLGGNFRVDVDTTDRVRQVVEKPPGGAPALKGCGLYAFTPAIFEAARRTPRDPHGNRGITDCIQTLIDLGRPVRAARVCRWDVNLNGAADLAIGEQRLSDLDTPEPPRRIPSAATRKESDRWRRTTA